MSDFIDLDLDTITPEIALRWQSLESLSLRGSWGESFLAPSALDVGPADRTGCVNNRTGQEPESSRNSEVIRVVDNINTNIVDMFDLAATYSLEYGN